MGQYIQEAIDNNFANGAKKHPHENHDSCNVAALASLQLKLKKL